jgi:hypothetical protein
MQVRLTVTFDHKHGGQKFEITCGSRDILAWEKAGPGRAAAQVIILTNFEIDNLYSLAFATLRRQELWSGTEKELRDQAELDLGHNSAPEVDDEAEPEGDPEDIPTQPDLSHGA